ncbi:MAG: chaperone NapD [Planctomycetes bacterium]|nr:chaperone NapD [Planctomycetota bacterium]
MTTYTPTEDSTTIATVGAFARIDAATAADVARRLEEIPGVETFPLDEPGKLGLVIEAEDLDRAHAIVTRDVRHAPGVLGVWPLYAHFDDGDEPDDEAPASTGCTPEGSDHALNTT